MKKNLLFILLGLITILVLPATTLGAVSSIADLVNNIRSALNLALGGIVIISWIIVAILYLIAQGNPEKYNMAKRALIWTIIGTGIYALGNIITIIINEAIRG